MNLCPITDGHLRAVLAQHGVVAHVVDGIRLCPGLDRPRVTIVRGHMDQRTIVERLQARGENSLATWVQHDCPAIVVNGRHSVILQHDCHRRVPAEDVVKLIDLAVATLTFAEHAATSWLHSQDHSRDTNTVLSLVDLVRMADANGGLLPASISAQLVCRARAEHQCARGRGRRISSTGLTAVSSPMSVRTSIHPHRVIAPLGVA